MKTRLDQRMTVLVVAASIGFLQAAADLSLYWERLEGYTLHKIEETEKAAGTPEDVLDEYTVVEGSSWQAIPRDGSRPVKLKVLEMLDPPGAFGLLAYRQRRLDDRFAERLEIGARNVFGGRVLLMATGTFFVRLEADPSTLAPREELSRLAGRLVRLFDQTDVDPVTVLNLPREDLERGSVGFYLGPASLKIDRRFPEPLLSAVGFRKGVQVSAADYRGGESLLLIGYPTPSLAREAETRFRSRSLPPGFEMKRSGILLALAEGEDPGSLLERVEYDPEVRWVEDEEGAVRTFQSEMNIVYGIFANWLLFSLLFIVLSLMAGGLVGCVRYAVHRRFPEYAERDSMIHLGLSDH